MIVDIDLEKFFDKVNHDKLMRLISNTIKTEMSFHSSENSCQWSHDG